MKPLAKYIVVKKIVEEKTMSSGVIMSAKDTKEERYQKGVLLAVGDEISNLKEKDTILFDANNSWDMLLNTEWITIIQYREVVMVL